MSVKNIANYTTFNDLLVNYLEIQSNGIGLVVYDQNITSPVFSVNPTAQTVDMTGTLNVVGSASFETITVSEFSAGMQSLATDNPGNTWDLGLNANYNDGTSKYTGVVKDVSDSFQRWTFFKDITTQPTTTVDGIDYTKLDSVRMNYLYVNDGSAATPSITFHNDTDNNTGFYLAAQNEVGIAAGGVKLAGMRYISGALTEIELNSNTSFKFKKMEVIDSTASLTLPSITTGHIYIKSDSAADKWLKFYSSTAAITPAYSGAVFTSPNSNYFMINTGTNLEIVKNNTVASETSAPDYRDATTAQILIIGSSSIESKNPIYITSGNVSTPSLAFSGESSTGLYRSGTNSIGISSNGTNILNITGSAITATRAVYNINGTISAPSLSFTSNTGTGIWRNNSAPYENISFSANGTSLGYFWLNTTPQWITGSAGSASAPSIAWSNSNNTGLFSPTSEAASGQLAISTSGVEIIRFRPRTGTGSGDIDIYNKMLVKPDGSISRLYISDSDTVLNNIFKTNEAWFQAYSLIDTSDILLFTFRSSGSIVKDYSKKATNAIAVGGPTIASAIQDGNGTMKRDVLDLTGNTSKYINLSNNLSYLTPLDNATISFWFRISGVLANDNTIFSCYQTAGAKEISIKILADGAAYPNALQLTIQSDSLTTLQYHTATASDLGTPSPISVKDGLWHHVVFHLGSGAGSPNPKHFMYYDNIELNIASNTIYTTSNGDNPGNPEASTNSFNDLTFGFAALGAFYNGTSGSLFYTGYLKDFYITGRLLSGAEINTLYSEPYVYTYGLDAAVINTSKINASSMLFSDGSSAAPSITFSSDDDTGVFRPDSNTLGISLGGVQTITTTSNVFSFAPTSDSTRFEFWASRDYLYMEAINGSLGPRIVFASAGGTKSPHSIRSNHNGGSPSNNWIDFYLYGGAIDAFGLGTNNVMRMSQTADGPNTANISIYGIQRNHNGSVSAPAFSFLNDTGSGLYRISSNNIGFSINGVLKMQFGSSITIGNDSGDITTRLYTPLGSDILPAYSFIGNTNTGIYSSAGDNIDITCGGIQTINFTNSVITPKAPIRMAIDDQSAFLIERTDFGGTVFQVDSVNARVNVGQSNYSLGSTATSAISGSSFYFDTMNNNSIDYGLVVVNSQYTGSSVCSALVLGKAAFGTLNYMRMTFTYIGDNNASNSFALASPTKNFISVVMGSNTTTINSILNVVNETVFSSYLSAPSGSVSVPSYTFTGDLTTGIYRIGAGNIGISASGNIVFETNTTYCRVYQPLRAANGSISTPSICFNSAQTAGFYHISGNRFGISNGNQLTWIYDNRGTAPHESLNEIQFKPDGTNLRLYVQDAKLRASSNQTILNTNPILHYKFSNDVSNTTTQDESIDKNIILATTATYTTSTISLTDSNGVGLLQYKAIQFITSGADRIETAGNLTNFVLLQNFSIMVKFKLASTSSGSLFEIYGNKSGSTTTNYIRINISSQNIVLNVLTTSTLISASTSSTPLSANVWYSLVLTFNGSGNSITLNGSAVTLNYTTGTAATQFIPTSFTSTANVVSILGGNSSSALGYFAEFYITPLTTTETATALYRTQAHELYTNKIQLGDPAIGLVDEGYILRSDKGNNLTWDNSLQIYPGYIQLNSSKVLRLPNGSASLPSYSFSSASDGMYLSTTNTLSFSTNGTQRMNISTTQLNTTLQTFINNATIPTDSATGALVVVGGIGLGNNSSTPSRINFGASYTFSGSTSNKLISLYDTANNANQFIGFGMNSGVLRYQTDATSSDHVFYAAANSSSSNELLRIKGTGVIHAQDGTAAAPSYSFVNSTGTGIFRTGAGNNLGISTSGVKRIDISDAITNISNEIQLGAGFRRAILTISTTSATLDSTHSIVICSYASDSSNIIITLPAASSNTGREYILIKTGNGGGSLIINTASGTDFIDDALTTSIILSNQYDRVTLICGQSNRWFTV